MTINILKKYGINLLACTFSESLSIVGVDDSQVCVGNKFSCSEVIFEVSQARKPCWKTSAITGIKKLTALIVKEYKTSFYLRILQSKSIKPSDKMELISRKYPNLSIELIKRT